MSYSSMYESVQLFRERLSEKAQATIPICVFSHDVMAAIFVSQNNETAAMFVCSKTVDTIRLYVFNLFHCLYGKARQQDEKNLH